MKHLFSSAGEALLESLSFTRTLYAFDFDGTLAPIVDNPDLAKPPAQTTRLLEALSKRARVAIISGRSVADLRKRLPVGQKLFIGNHGLEGLGGGSSAHARASCQRWMTRLVRPASPLRLDPGIVLEDKTYSIALHYRSSRKKKEARNRILAEAANLQPAPRVILGKCVVNVVPAGGPHKGVALLEAMVRLKLLSALYVGDDDTDEDVFALPDARVMTVRVGQRAASQAQFYLKRQSEIQRLLRRLLALHSAQGD